MTLPSVGICFGTYPPLRNGGADFVEKFAGALAALGCSVHVVTSSVEGHEDTSSANGVTIHRIVDDWRLGRRSLERVDGVLRAAGVDVVHVVFPDSVVQERYQLPAALALRRRTPLVTTFWNLGLGRRSPWLIRGQALALLARSRALTSHDPSYLAHLRRLGFGRPVEWLPVGNNIGRADRSDRVGGAFRLVYFGQLDFTRGVEDLFEAIRLLPHSADVQLTMLGSASRPERYASRDELDRYLALPGRLGIESSVRWTDYLPDDETAAVLAGADLCVLPYRRNSIGRSALAAALDNGAPVVLAGTREGIAPLRDGEHVALVPPAQPALLARRLEELIRDRDRLDALARGARTAAAYFAWGSIAETATALYARVLG